ncbi:hypothetical protein F4811DRAFT_210577 [Daldinia bambusicola]|nr:hypothetical protein F4811DRAFT_210577 [Daldinia bambusicola]
MSPSIKMCKVGNGQQRCHGRTMNSELDSQLLVDEGRSGYDTTGQNQVSRPGPRPLPPKPAPAPNPSPSEPDQTPGGGSDSGRKSTRDGRQRHVRRGISRFSQAALTQSL